MTDPADQTNARDRRGRAAAEERLARAYLATGGVVGAPDRAPALRGTGAAFGVLGALALVALVLPWATDPDTGRTIDAFAVPETVPVRWVAAVAAVAAILLPLAGRLVGRRVETNPWTSTTVCVVGGAGLALLPVVGSTLSDRSSWEAHDGGAPGAWLLLAVGVGLVAAAASLLRRAEPPSGSLGLADAGGPHPTDPLTAEQVRRLARHLRSRLDDGPDGTTARPAEAAGGFDRVRAGAVAVSLVGLSLVGVASLTPWLHLDLPVLDGLGPEVPDGFGEALSRGGRLPLGAIQAAAVVGLAAVLLLAAFRRTRVAAGAAAVVAGAAVAVLTLRGIDGATVHDGSSRIVLTTAPRLALAGGVAAALAGLVALVGSAGDRRLPAAGLAGVAVVAGLGVGAVVPVADREPPARRGPFEVVLGGAGDALLWGVPADAADLRGLVRGQDGAGSASVGVDLDGGPGAWVLAEGDTSYGDVEWIVGELVDGRLLPRTRIEGSSSWAPTLVGVTGGDALLVLDGGTDPDGSGVVRVSLDRDEARLPYDLARPEADGDLGGTTVLAAVGSESLDERSLRSATAQADGSVVVAVEDDGGPDRVVVVPADVVASGAP